MRGQTVKRSNGQKVKQSKDQKVEISKNSKGQRVKKSRGQKVEQLYNHLQPLKRAPQLLFKNRTSLMNIQPPPLSW